MRGNIGQMMKQAQMMQENMRRMQELQAQAVAIADTARLERGLVGASDMANGGVEAVEAAGRRARAPIEAVVQ
jgi:DNA-binding protein YbaB